MRNHRLLRKHSLYVTVIALLLLLWVLWFIQKADSSIQPLSEQVATDDADIASVEKIKISEPVWETHFVSVTSGDTLSLLFEKTGLSSEESYGVIYALKKIYNPRNIKPGNEISVVFRQPEGNVTQKKLQWVTIDNGSDYKFVIDCSVKDQFVAQKEKKLLHRQILQADGVIESSLYEAAAASALPLPVLMQMIHAFSFDVDFQRDIQVEDGFEVLFERVIDDKGVIVHEGPVLYAALTTRESTLRIYRYTTHDGITAYYNEKGQTVSKTLLRTPVDGARLSSGFGLRKHPILGYSRMHRGVDFAAPLGTAVVASGSGVVTFAGRKGDYGKCLKIRHVNGYDTLYAHFQSFARGIKQGTRVKQGETIGFVGSTGLSTGPHLHYEVHYNKKPINPSKVKFPPRRVLADAELTRFMKAKAELDHQFASLVSDNSLARLE